MKKMESKEGVWVFGCVWTHAVLSSLSLPSSFSLFLLTTQYRPDAKHSQYSFRQREFLQLQCRCGPPSGGAAAPPPPPLELGRPDARPGAAGRGGCGACCCW